MGSVFKEIKNYIQPGPGVYVEIGSDRGEGSTQELAELAQRNGTKLITVDISDRARGRLQTQLPEVEFVVADGASWAREFAHFNSDTDVACVYLDNFDYIWDINEVRPAIKMQMHEYASRGVAMTNQQCQLEHMRQIVELYSLLTPTATVVLDDTFLKNDCWMGKSAGVVLYLLAKNWQVVHQTLDCGVILQRQK
jgi:hypothetical protein